MRDEFFNDLRVYTDSFIKGISGTFQELPQERKYHNFKFYTFVLMGVKRQEPSRNFFI